MAQLNTSDQQTVTSDILSGTSQQSSAVAGDPGAAAPLSNPNKINGGTFGTGPDTLVLTLAEDAFQGDAQFNVAVDGVVLNATPLSVTALKNQGQSETFTFKGTFGNGAHDLAVSFLNDAYAGTPTTDRNLYVNGASYDGLETRPTTATLDTAMTEHFTIPPASDPEAFPTTVDRGTFGTGPDTLVVTLAEDAFQGDARANIAIDGVVLNASPLTVTALDNAGRNDQFTFKGTFGTGAHDLAVSFLNDAYAGTPTTDRNLYVNGASYDGIATRPTTAVLDTAGTAHFTIPPAGDPESTVALAGGAQHTNAMHSMMPMIART